MNPDLAPAQPAPFVVHLVTGGGSSPELALLLRSLAAARVVALDGEWKPRRRGPADPGDDTSPAPAQPTQPKFPTVTLLQVACRGDGGGGGEVFVVDLLAVPLADLWAPLRELFERPEVLKLGFRFKQDLVYLSATFAAALGSDAGFDRVEPFLDVTNVYYYLKGHDRHKRLPKETKSLATICEEVLNVSLSKELQCSDWSCRPLSEGQIQYAALDAYYLLDIFDLFQQKIRTEGECLPTTELTSNEHYLPRAIECSPSGYAICSDGYWTSIVTKYSEKILLTESDTKPRSSRQKEKPKLRSNAKCKEKSDCSTEWQGPPPWDPSIGGDRCPKFLCDVMIEGLAKHLRCVGIDAAIPSSRKPEPRELLNQTYKEGRILLTRDLKLLKYQYLASNQVYRVKSLLKHDQLAEMSSVASGGATTPTSSSVLKRNSEDIGWEYGYLDDPNNLDKVKCRLCQKVIHGGVYRLKQHIGHIRGNVARCLKSTQEEQMKCRKSIEDAQALKKAKKAKEQELRNEVIIEKQDDLNEDEELEVVGGSAPRTLGPMDKFACPIDTSIALTSRQQNIKDALWKERNHKVKQYVVRWLYAHGVPFNAINNDEFKQMCEAIGRFGPGFVGPSQYDCREKLLKEEVERTKDLLKTHEEERALTGCSIMTDAWTDQKRRSIMNVCVHCKLGTSFIESKEASDFNPAIWWSTFGYQVPTLQRMAIRILSLTSSSSGCERNWSTFDMIHSKRRNRLDVKRLNNLVYVQFNARLLSKKEKSNVKNIDVILASDATQAQGWIIDGGDDDQEVEAGTGLTWKVIDEASGASEAMQPGRSTRVRDLYEDDFSFDSEEDVNEGGDDIEFESDQDEVVVTRNYEEDEDTNS